MSQTHVVLVEDDKELRESLSEILELNGMSVTAFASADKALPCIQYNSNSVVVSDIRMPNMDGMTFLQHLQQLDNDLPVVLISGHADIETALQCIKLGAFDFVEKPLRPEHLVGLVTKAIQHRELTLENRRLKQNHPRTITLDELLIGESDSMKKLKTRLITLANADVNIVINGETGTGKEKIARTLHSQSERNSKPFVAINCGAMPENLIESELFGHEAGSFTGASKKRIGKIEYASGGTLFLDEIESMPLSAQIRLLRVIQEGELERVGSNQTVSVDLKVLSASKDDLFELSQKGEFRQDLYYRLNVATLDIPPLRERKSDIPVLLGHFIHEAEKRLNQKAPALTPLHFQHLMNHDWPGNVRELMNEADRIVLGISDLIFTNNQQECHSLAHQLTQFEFSVLHHTLTQFSGHIGDTAEHLDIPRKNLYLRMKKFGLKKEDYTTDSTPEE
ncbi:C4-dicarboxylate transport transcriptional regulatory protein dctD [Vibrio nigripulchritudo SO65]|uniref:sigma-54-dependent transcriptional regulator n=1 Tax=Vibrio nigripulchritudo TaxID=28173 RepID=UPI0003B180B5|nr:sigma-54 dependent transcriptional regulator [Vibrio nigripulchritudo]CCN38122.1 C4-dicarboxylate transport transcriptional regulatory protein dctD [Vibrio nigripulchritudo AM115]CCN43849.1 C4-dicarboxylate transport transcriptional regulatory protein dctD [Vibrio nigripulchritudo FTn2]CCN64611.1 C4-dicarboxylate transport transcriptional regulatory protein dctD [Vibrio nigripulchritudo POn4]CCN77117.1 C4-dicarboxylate transport transcriptional regulatory protein dctD [Vibrio nigripulchritud